MCSYGTCVRSDGTQKFPHPYRNFNGKHPLYANTRDVLWMFNDIDRMRVLTVMTKEAKTKV